MKKNEDSGGEEVRFEYYGNDMKDFSAWWMLIVLMIVISFPVFFALDSFGLIGRTIVEREVFERSYQRQEAQKTKQNTIAAQLAEIDALLSNPEIQPREKAELEAKARALRILANN